MRSFLELSFGLPYLPLAFDLLVCEKGYRNLSPGDFFLFASQPVLAEVYGAWRRLGRREATKFFRQPRTACDHKRICGLPCGTSPLYSERRTIFYTLTFTKILFVGLQNLGVYMSLNPCVRSFHDRSYLYCVTYLRLPVYPGHVNHLQPLLDASRLYRSFCF